MTLRSEYLSSRQQAALARSRKLGQALAAATPVIAEFYRAGATTYQLAEKYLPQQMEISRGIAMNAVRYALQQLLSPEELRELGRIHESNGGITGGNSTFRGRKGIHAQTLEERLGAARNGYQKGLGRCSNTVLSYARLKGLLVQGKIPYSEEEKQALIQLAADSRYQYPAGSNKAGRPAYFRIQEELFQRFGVKRTDSALRVAYCRLTTE